MRLLVRTLVRLSCRLVSSRCFNVTLEDVAELDDCCPSGHDSSLDHLVWVFVSGAVSLSQVDVAFNVLHLRVVDIYLCIVFHHHLSSSCSSSVPIFTFIG